MQRQPVQKFASVVLAIVGVGCVLILISMIRCNAELDDRENWTQYRGRVTASRSGMEGDRIASLVVTWSNGHGDQHSDHMMLPVATVRRLWERADKPMQDVYVYEYVVCLDEVFEECSNEAKSSWVALLLLIAVAGLSLGLLARELLKLRHREGSM